MHRRGRHGKLHRGDQPGQLHHQGGGPGDLPQGGGQRLRPPDHQYRRRAENFRHLQLQRQRLLRPADIPTLQHAQPEPQRLCCQGGAGELRGLRPLRGVLPRRRREAGSENLYQGRPRGVSPSRAAGRRQVGPGEVGRGLPGQQPHQLLRHRHLPLQDRLSRPHRRAGLSEAGGPRQVHRGAPAH